MLENKILSSGTYHLDAAQNLVKTLNQPKSLTEGDGFDHTLPESAAIEHLEWQIVEGGDFSILIIGGIHGDEFDTPQVFENHTQQELPLPRMQVLRAHVAAVFRGLREYDTPDKDIDFNRQFTFDGTEETWEDFYEKVQYPEAKLLLKLLEDNPKIEYIFSLHEDETHKENFYFYDNVYDARLDTQKHIVKRNKDRFIAALLEANFSVLNGIDDEEDPDLGLLAVDGYIYQPLINSEGVRKTDTTFETGAVETGGKKVSNVKRVFTFEALADRKAEFLRILQREFIMPLTRELKKA